MLLALSTLYYTSKAMLIQRQPHAQSFQYATYGMQQMRLTISPSTQLSCEVTDYEVQKTNWQRVLLAVNDGTCTYPTSSHATQGHIGVCKVTLCEMQQMTCHGFSYL
jgi:hypothetical protein